MKIRDVLVIVIAAMVTLSAVAAHGWIRARWGGGIPADQTDALSNFPSKFGEWERKASKEIDPVVLKQLECDPQHCFDHVYYNPTLDAAVEIAVFLGPAGPVAVHTPDVCYRNTDFKIIDSKPIEVGRHNLQHLVMERKSIDKTKLLVSYAWLHDDRWEVSDSPRFAFAFKRHLYKLQLAAVEPVSASAEADAPKDSLAVAFLEDFIPTFEQHVLGR